MINNGYLLMNKDSSPFALDFNKGYTKNGFAKKVFHLHLKHLGDWGELYFRDYLIDNPDIAEEYGQLKLALCPKYKNDRDSYTKAKTDFITLHTRKAKELYQGRYQPSI